ncbi:MAG: hypothetical protein GY772_06320 [bacterium]|nr:hypothetical protein [bacterium]
MHLHPNAKLTPKTRRLLVERIRQDRWPVSRTARAAGIRVRFFDGMQDRCKGGGSSSPVFQHPRPCEQYQ